MSWSSQVEHSALDPISEYREPTGRVDICASLFQTVRMTRRVPCHHVQGHSGHPWNEMADCLAATAARRRWRCSPSLPQQILCLHHEHPDAPLHIGPSCYMPRRLLLLLTQPWTRTSWYARFLLQSHALTTSCRREPSSLPLSHGPLSSLVLQPPRTSTPCFPTRLPWRASWSPDVRFLWPSSFWRLPSPSLPCKRRVPASLAQADFPGTLPFPLMLVPKPCTVRSYGFARLPQIAVRMIVPPFGTNRFTCALRIPASSQSLPRH